MEPQVGFHIGPSL